MTLGPREETKRILRILRSMDIHTHPALVRLIVTEVMDRLLTLGWFALRDAATRHRGLVRSRVSPARKARAKMLGRLAEVYTLERVKDERAHLRATSRALPFTDDELVAMLALERRLRNRLEHDPEDVDTKVLLDAVCRSIRALRP